MPERLTHYKDETAPVDVGAEATAVVREYILGESPTTALGVLVGKRILEREKRLVGNPRLDMPTQVWLEGVTVEAVAGLSGNYQVPNVQRVLDALVKTGLAVTFSESVDDIKLQQYAAMASGIEPLLTGEFRP